MDNNVVSDTKNRSCISTIALLSIVLWNNSSSSLVRLLLRLGFDITSSLFVALKGTGSSLSVGIMTMVAFVEMFLVQLILLCVSDGNDRFGALTMQFFGSMERKVFQTWV